MALAINLTMQLPTGGTPVPSISPTQVSGSPNPSVSVSSSPSINNPSPATGNGNPTSTPTSGPVPTKPITSATCTNPTHTIQIDPSNPQNGITLDQYYLSADTWNAKGFNITQTVYVCNYNNWYVVEGKMSEAGGVKTYPNVHEDFNNVPISSFKTVTSTFASDSPRIGIYDAAYEYLDK